MPENSPFPPEARTSCMRLALWVTSENDEGRPLASLAAHLKLSTRHLGHLLWLGRMPPELVTEVLTLDPPARVLCAEVAARRKHYAANNWAALRALLAGMRKGRVNRKRTRATGETIGDAGNVNNRRKVEELVRQALGTKVRAVSLPGGGMTVSVELYSLEDVEDFLDKVTK